MGGGAMRTAAKAAALGGYRSPALYAAARRPPHNTASVAPPTAEVGPSFSLLTSEMPRPEAASISSSQRPAWELDDWEFAGWPEEKGVVYGSPVQAPPASRLVFGPVPTLEEAKEATSDLKDAVEKVYFSKTPATYATSNPSTGHQEFANREALAIIPSMSHDVVQAFSLLHGSTQAQEVVASIASDKNVWDAVMKNEKVMEFYRTHRATITFHPERDDDSVSSVAENEIANLSPENSAKLVFEEFVHNIRTKVEEVVSNISSFFQDLLGTSTETSTSTRAGSTFSNADIGIGASFFALAVAAILVILVKRN